jgi:hypothetical protein
MRRTEATQEVGGSKGGRRREKPAQPKGPPPDGKAQHCTNMAVPATVCPTPESAADAKGRTADLLQIPAAVAAVVGAAGAVAAVSSTFRVVSLIALAVAGTVLWLQLRLGRRWRSWRVLATGACCALAAAGVAYSLVPRPEPGLPAQFTIGNIQGADGSVALPSATRLSARQLSALNAKNQLTDGSYAAWFADRGFAYTGQVTVEVQAQGNLDHTVRIINIVPVERCSAPYSGTLFSNPGQAENLNPQLYLDLNDPSRPVAYTREGSAAQQQDYFRRYSISLRQGEQETFDVTAVVRRRSCQFTLNMTVLDGSSSVTETVSDHGQPFRLTSQGGFASYQDLYLGGAISEQITKGQLNQYEEAPWIRADPKTYR